MDRNKIYVITDSNERLYFCGFKSSAGYLIIGEKKTLFVDARYIESAKNCVFKDCETKLFRSFSDVENEIKSLGASEIYINYEKTSVSEYEKFRSCGVAVKDGKEDLYKTFEIKTDAQTEMLRRACAVTQKALYAVLPLIKEGITEIETADILERKIKEYGGDRLSFPTIAAFGKNTSVPHHETSHAKLCKNSPVLIDTGAAVGGYCADLTRTAFYGNPDSGFLRAYECVLRANETAIAKITAGITCKAADKIARKYLADNGYGEYFTHSLGHGVGLEIHERPYLNEKSETALADGMAFTVEPGVYFEGRFGIRIEDTCVMKNGRAERLFTDDKKLILL